ncbi:hypothetical protein [Agrobacterium tumefaciens]|uniref:hypothetical protein n=1 Tax=Agrobacterium tumefaciens TaxID=358 RepID=UPI001FA9534E|nr:hypothetical protein [Agrobacterium tumefaciens]UNZ53847.1 hypothetical protein MLE07_24235 [Agrobacterium tumefaciens]
MSRSTIQFAVDEIMRNDIDEFAGDYSGGEVDQDNILGGTRAATWLARFRGTFGWGKPFEQILATSDSPQLSGGGPT